ncbi:MAG: outer membrane lipoprotein-sorting protein, partial [Gammaproteobacteria bacterium]
MTWADDDSGAQAHTEMSGEAIMLASRARHGFYPYVFERVDLITTDRRDRKSVRQARRYWRLDGDGGAHFLWVFEQPPELRGVAVLASFDAESDSGVGADVGLYLPAFGHRLKRGSDQTGADARSVMGAMNILGTDFSIQDLSPEDVDAHVYQRMDDVVLNETRYFQISAKPRFPAQSRLSGFSERRLLIRAETLMLERADYFDHRGRLVKRLTRHDLKPFDGETWRAGMSLMQDFRTGHSTLIKVRERVDSADYVPSALFTKAALFAGQHLLSPGD